MYAFQTKPRNTAACYIFLSSSCSGHENTPVVPSRELTDEENAARVVITEILKSSPATPNNPKVAFMFLTPGPLPFEMLWDKFFQGHDGRFTVYVHASREQPAHASPYFRRRNIRSEKVDWGKISMVDAERRLLMNALQDPDNQQFVLLSDSCVPLHNFDYVYNYLIFTNLSFIDCYDDPGPHGAGGRYSEHMLPEIEFKDFRKGSQWFTMTRKHALIIMADSLYYRKFRLYCRPGFEGRNCYADEHYFQTLFYMVDPGGIANWSVTYVDWSERKWHPRSYKPQDITSKLLRNLTTFDIGLHFTSDEKKKEEDFGRNLMKMGVKLVQNCYRSASRHPLLVFMICVLIWIYRSFPVLFSILLHASPVIASTLVLLGTLLFYGHANAPQIQKEEKSHHHDVSLAFVGLDNAEIDEETHLVHNINFIDDHNKLKQEAKIELGNRKPILVNRYGQFQPFETGIARLRSRDGSRRNSIDPSHTVLGHIDDDDDDDKGWDTGSDVVEGSSPSASIADIFQMLNEHHPLMDSDVHLGSGDMINETDDDDDDDDREDMLVKDFDEDDTYITWTENDQRNLMNLGTLELERNQRLESLIARQKAIKNMRMMAEKNMANISSDIRFISTDNDNPFDLSNHSHENIFGSDPSNMLQRRHSLDLPYDLRVPERIASDRESIGSTHTSVINDHIIPRNRFSEYEETVKLQEVAEGDDRSNEVITSGENTGYEDKTSDKSSSSSFFDVPDDIYDGDDVKNDVKDNLEEDYNSIDNSSSSTSDSQDEDSEDSDTEEEAGMAQRLKSWLTTW
ncbi:hypothetical protein E3N88_10937 [Mikania micrantha]|uniref:Uncharacterized protein n=1 Tax=Mikania micrantha TaxID=192012 RepID=A0A5N6PEY3_9ASTR|nr:hypothetical protein E3N88_10937 [Mikania micrantha]